MQSHRALFGLEDGLRTAPAPTRKNPTSNQPDPGQRGIA